MKFKFLKKITGIILIVIGIIGLFLPIMQGILLIIAGLLLMGYKKKDIDRWIKKIKFKIFLMIKSTILK